MAPPLPDAATAGVGLAGTQFFQPISHPELKQLGQVNVRKFIRMRDAYTRAIAERADQEGVQKLKPVSLKYSVDPDLLLSLIDLAQFGTEVDSVDKLTEDHLRTWLESHQEIGKAATSLSHLDSLVSKHLHLRMQEKNIQLRIMTVFTDYTTLLRSNGLSWVIKDAPKVAVRQIVGVLRPQL
jgi:hypothetical protein